MELSHNQLDKIRESDLPEIMIQDGVKIRRVNQVSFKGICPFHPDKNPSLSVNLKGRVWLWHCFGCNAGGDVIRYVMLKENLDFNGAVKSILPDYGKYESNIPQVKVLESVVNYYHEVLTTNMKAQAYLDQRGLLDHELIKRYKIGYSDGTLPRDVNLRQPLVDLGILTVNNKEHFKDCVVFPIEDESGRIVSLYGRNIKIPQHLYLKGPHKGVFNAHSLNGTRRAYITESIIDALSLIKLGLNESIALYGTNGFTKDHLDLLKYSSLKEVYLCLDNDPQGQKSQEALISKIPLSINHVYKIPLPENIKDPNDYLLSGKSKDDLLKTREEVVRSKDLIQEEDDWIVKENERDITLQIKQRTYRVRGLTTERLDILKLTLRIDTDKGYHLDSLDLYSAKQRNSFAKQTQKLVHVESSIIEQDLKFLIEKLEEIQTRILDRRTLVKKRVVMTDKEKTQAMEYLKSPDLWERILTDAKLTGHVGEENNFMLGYLVSISRKLKTPLGLLMISQSSAGKTALQDKVVFFTPPEDVIQVTRITDQSLFYQEKDALKHKLLTIEEEEGAQGAGYAIRHLLSARVLSSLSTVKDELEGRLKSVKSEVEGPTSMMLTTTHSEINFETYNRFIIITIDESYLQTRAILAQQRKGQTLEGVIDQRKNEQLQKLHHNMQRLLKPAEIINPYAEKLIFTDSVLRARREQIKYMSLIKAIALLRQYQKEVKTSYDGKTQFEYIEVDKKDIEIANRIARPILAQALDEMTPQTAKFLKLIDTLVKDLQEKSGKDRLEIPVSRREMREYTLWSDYQTRKHIEELVGLEYLIPTQGSKGKRFNYLLAWDDESSKRNDIVLQSVDNL